MAEYQFSTVWRVEASLQEVWEVFSHPDQWPEWVSAPCTVIPGKGRCRIV